MKIDQKKLKIKSDADLLALNLKKAVTISKNIYKLSMNSNDIGLFELRQAANAIAKYVRIIEKQQNTINLKLKTNPI